MKRGDIVLVRFADSPASKPRPCIIVTRASAVDVSGKITVCPLTTTLRGTAGQRPFVAPSNANRLQKPSEVEVDWVFTHPINCIGAVIGSVDTATMNAIDEALRNWLDL